MTDPDTCEHVWKLDTPPTREARVVRLKCIKCGVIQDYSSEVPHEGKEISKATDDAR